MEYFREIAGFRRLLEEFVSEEFLRKIGERYHYAEADLPLLAEVAGRMKRCIYEEAALEQRETQGDAAAVVMMLGAGVDALQDAYAGEGRLSECYMIEVLGSELLLRGYAAYNQLVSERSGKYVARYLFPGSGSECAVETLPELLAGTKLPVSCTEGYCMIPKKSVAFWVTFTEEKNKQCEGVCVGCGREDCPNRIGQSGSQGLPQAHMADLPLTYGYARILGRRYP